MTIGNDPFGSVPGSRAAKESEERQVWLSGHSFTGIWSSSSKIKLDSTNTDPGNTGFTNTLRAGNLISTQLASGNEYIYDPDANDGRQEAFGVLEHGISMLEDGVSTVQGPLPVLVRGIMKEQILIGVDAQARAQLARQGIQMDDPGNGDAFLIHPKGTWQKAASYTVTAADTGRHFQATAAVTFTLPTIAVGLSYEFFQTADANMIINGASNIMGLDGVVFDTITFSTSSEKIGAYVRLLAVYTSTSTLKWRVELLCGNTVAYAT